MNKKHYCHGCGIELQTKNEDLLGFINKIDEQREYHYCKRCYEMIFRNKAPRTFLEDKDYWELFNSILSTKDLYVLIIDLFNIEGSILDMMVEKLINKNIIIVINKRDLIPKLVNDSKIYSSIKNHYKLKNLNIIDHVVVSSKKKYNIDLLLEKINYHRKNDVYLIGVANVGKSSLVNALINSVNEGSKEYISTSYYAGTTLGLIKVPIDEKNYLIDTPGIINTGDINNKLDKETLENLIPKKEIRPRTYQLNSGQSLFISGLCQLNYLEGEKQGFSIYASNYCPIHRTKYENSLKFREDNLGHNIIDYPSVDELDKIEFKEEDIIIKGSNVDLVISGLGWINFKNIRNELKLSIVIPTNVSYYIRKGLI